MSVVQLNATTPTARKEHRCDCCGRVIRKGEQYESQSNVYDGRAYTYKVCVHCKRATSRALALNDSWDDGITPDWIEEVLRDDRETVADLRMLVQFRRRWTRRDGTLYPVPTEGRELDATVSGVLVVCPCGSSLATENGGTLEHHTDGSHTFHPAVGHGTTEQEQSNV